MKSLDEAINSVISCLNSNLKSEFVNLNAALGRVLAMSFKALRNSPVFDNSALDGYAYNVSFKGEFLQLVEPTIFAGCKEIYEIKENEAQKIMTGAPFPKGANSVIRLEDAEFENGKLKMPKDPKFGDGHRKMGEEFANGEVLIKKGEILTPTKIMLLASQGVSKIEVFTKPKIALFSSGDELLNLGQEAGNFGIFDANSHGVSTLLLSNGFECENLGIIKDDYGVVLDTLKKICKNYDIIITSGGASVGEADFMEKVAQKLGFENILNDINLKPGGKPMKCFKNGEKLFFILPGNPMAAYILSLVFMLPILRYLSGNSHFKNKEFNAVLEGNLKFSPKRVNLILGDFNEGKFIPKFDKFSSFMISPLANSSFVFLTPLGKECLNNGDLIKILKAY
ncbi:MAG: molybdopterin molybdotransferase MoeA [Campylobacter sp.]|nr:molybdopterin molybdotransferase MoeA [Campylobacter sp.]